MTPAKIGLHGDKVVVVGKLHKALGRNHETGLFDKGKVLQPGTRRDPPMQNKQAGHKREGRDNEGNFELRLFHWGKLSLRNALLPAEHEGSLFPQANAG